MKKSAASIALIGLVAGLTLMPTTAAGVDDEAKLAKNLRRYEQEGPPMSCVPMYVLGGNRLIGATAIIFYGQGSQIFVNRLAAPCPMLRMGRALQTDAGGRLCRGELVTVWDPPSGMEYGTCPLGDFTPYRRRRR